MILDGLQPMSIIHPMPGVSKPSAKPIIKWAGGKQALAPHLASLFPRRFEKYYEPFVGGASVFLTLAPRRAVISDENEWLIDTYRAVREDWKAVARILDTLTNTKAAYLRIRKVRPTELEAFQRAAHLIYLNKTCFRGLFRVNKQGQFNVPYGAYKRRYYDPKNLECFSEVLKDVEIRCGDFELAIYGVTRRDFIYFDPPYYKLGGYSDFNRYTATKFYAADHVRLAAVCRELDRRNIRWAVSNSNTPFVRSLFKSFSIRKIAARREIKLQSQERDVSELLITNY